MSLFFNRVLPFQDLNRYSLIDAEIFHDCSLFLLSTVVSDVLLVLAMASSNAYVSSLKNLLQL